MFRKTMQRIYPGLALAQLSAGLLLLFAAPLFADDCQRDRTRAED